MLQSRVSRQVIKKLSETDSDYELEQPGRVSLAELKTRGKKAVVPKNRTGPAIKSVSKGLSLRVPTVGESSSHSSNSKLVVYDENKADAAPLETKFEPWLAPPPAKAKENEKVVEKWCDVKMRQKSRFGNTMMDPPPTLKPTFQPYVEESDELPKMTPCKIYPTVNNVLSARKPCREDTPLKKLLEHKQRQKEAESGKELEKSMYCKELLFSGTTEFSLEELRAELYSQTKKNSEAGSCPDNPPSDPATN